MGKFGLYSKFTTNEGKRDELVDILLKAAASMEELVECELYLVSISDSEPNAIWVTEVWLNAEAHQASLSLEETQAMIQQARPLIASMERLNTFTPVGGKGI